VVEEYEVEADTKQEAKNKVEDPCKVTVLKEMAIRKKRTWPCHE
jgi:hypothetical protein